MSRYPGATWRPVTRYDVGGSNHVAMAFPRRVVLHTAVSSSPSLFGLFNTPGNPVAHFYVDEAGQLEQYVDSAVRASAVLDGNHDCITFESWDGYTGKPGWEPPPWNAAQVEAIAKAVAWCCKTHDIPAEQLPSSRPGTTGIGWHRQGIDGNFPAGLLAGRISGGEVWSSSTGKTCPGDNRIRQVPAQIIPRVIEILNGDDEMQQADFERIRGIVRDVVTNNLAPIEAELGEVHAGLAAFRANELTRDQNDAQRDRELSARLDKIEAAIAKARA